MYPVEVEEDTYKVQASLESPDIEVLFQAATPERTYAYTGNAVEPVTGVKIKQGVNQPVTMTHINTLADGVNRTKGAVAASDAFFPFADGAEILINAGVKAIVQPGGSIRDEEVFEAARKAGVTMYVTGTRHFFH